MRDHEPRELRRAAEHEGVRALGSTAAVVGAALLGWSFGEATIGIPVHAVGAALFLIGLLAVRVPALFWAPTGDPPPETEPVPLPEADPPG